MDELDFSSTSPQPTPKPAPTPAAPIPLASLYTPAVALQFFKAAGELIEVPGGKSFFAEGDKAGGFFSSGSKMYLLLDGDVGLMARGAFVGNIKPGAIFGEVAMLAKAPRTASAMAKVNSKALSLDEKQFHTALQKIPEFALMMMAVMVNRLRQNVARHAQPGAAPAAKAPTGVVQRAAVFNQKELASFADEIPPVRAAVGQTIMKAGDTGVFMYVVHDGMVAISINGTVVERVGPGGVFGEMALVDNAQRAATATAEAASELMLVKRADFLSLIKAKPQFGASVLRNIADRLRASS